MSYSDGNSFEEILKRCLENETLSGLDKRTGSVVYNLLAPLCLELAEAYIRLDIMSDQLFITTATGENLDKVAYNYLITRNGATQAKKIGSFKKYSTNSSGNKILVDMNIEVGTRFVVPDNANLTFIYNGITDGYKVLLCEQAGTVGNEYTGNILPIVAVAGLAEAKILSTYTSGKDEENDDELRARVIKYLNETPFGGNIYDYVQKVTSLDGVGQVKVFPAWQYRGSVLLSVVDASFDPITDEFAAILKEKIDPDRYTGEGQGIAPIGHYVTITTPTKDIVNVKLKVQVMANYTVSQLTEAIKEQISNYFDNVRKSFAQDVTLGIYISRIISAVLNIATIVNVTEVMLNETETDIIYNDEAGVGTQYLPYLGEVEIE